MARARSPAAPQAAPQARRDFQLSSLCASRATGKVSGQSKIPPPKEKVATKARATQSVNFLPMLSEEVASSRAEVKRKFVNKRTNWKPHIQFSACTGEKSSRLINKIRRSALSIGPGIVRLRMNQRLSAQRPARTAEKNISARRLPWERKAKAMKSRRVKT